MYIFPFLALLKQIDLLMAEIMSFGNPFFEKAFLFSK